MNKPTLLSLVLGAALIGTNVLWVYWAVDAGLSHTYQAVSLEEHQEALAQTLAVIRTALQPNATREQIIAAAAATETPSPTVFEKDGYTWVGQIGLGFADDGRLVEVVPAWSSMPPEGSEPLREPQ